MLPMKRHLSRGLDGSFLLKRSFASEISARWRQVFQTLIFVGEINAARHHVRISIAKNREQVRKSNRRGEEKRSPHRVIVPETRQNAARYNEQTRNGRHRAAKKFQNESVGSPALRTEEFIRENSGNSHSPSA